MVIVNLLINTAPLLLIVFAALVSQYAGVMAVFLEGILNLSAFLTLSFTIFFNNPIFGVLTSVLTCSLLIIFTAFFTEYTKANPFMTGLSINLFSDGLISVLSSLWFNTRGVITIDNFASLTSFTRIYGTVFSYFIIVLMVFGFYQTKWGLRTKITGEEQLVLKRYGVSPKSYRIIAWFIATILTSLAGSSYTFRLASFVPNISSGKGWIAIAIVFLGRQRVSNVILATLFFTASEMFALWLQGFSFFNITIPPTILLSVPYIIVLVIFAITPNLHKKAKEKEHISF